MGSYEDLREAAAGEAAAAGERALCYAFAPSPTS
jgi:hypothetical protein